MIITLTADIKCPCGRDLRAIEVVGARINLRSIRTDGKGLIAIDRCPNDCDNRTYTMPEAWRLTDESLVKVNAAREKLRARRKRVAS